MNVISTESVRSGVRTRLELLPGQKPPVSEWDDWLILGGRGFGKTTALCAWLRDRVFCGPNDGRWAIVGPRSADIRDIIVEGCSGILASSPPWFMPRYYPSKRKLVWPNGATGFTYSSEDSSRLLGAEFHGAICDEASRFDDFDACYENLRSGIRAARWQGWRPQVAWSMQDDTYSVKPASRLLNLPRTVVNPGSFVESVFLKGGV